MKSADLHLEIQFYTSSLKYSPVLTVNLFQKLVPPPLFTALLVASDEPVLAKKIMTEMLYQTFLPRFPTEQWTVRRLPFKSPTFLKTKSNCYDFDFNYRTQANARLKFLRVPKGFAVFRI